MTVDKVKLKALAEAATPQDFDSAEEKSGNGYIECPHCGGQGEVELEADYCNYDGTAIGVQFYGIGSEHGAAEAYYRAANPAAVLALLAEIESLSKDLESHKRMLLSAAVSIGTIGEALGAEMDDDPSELEGLAAELRKNAERYRFFRDSQQVSDNGDGWSVMYLDNSAGGLGGGVMQADFTDLDEATDFAMSKQSPNKKMGD